MKYYFLLLSVLFIGAITAQEQKAMSLISVTGEGKIKIAPDQVLISLAVESKGSKANAVKTENDIKIDGILKYIKKMGVDAKDFQTQSVYLNDQYDYEKKKHNYVANENIEILLKDLSKYDFLMEGLLDLGLNTINNVEFKSSKFESYKSEVRKLAIKNAKQKADDFASAVNQKVGRAYTISDSSQSYQPHSQVMMLKSMSNLAEMSPRETLAVGEIEITASVVVSFILD